MTFTRIGSIKKLIYLNLKVRSVKEDTEYAAMLRHHDFTDEFITLLIQNNGKNEAKKILWGKTEFSNEDESMKVLVIFLLFMAIVYFIKKDKKNR
jgi:hypothetical protein